MAQTIKQKVEIEYSAKGLETIINQLKQQEKIVSSKEGKNKMADLRKEAENLLGYIKKQGSNMTPAVGKEIDKLYKKIMSGFSKSRELLSGNLSQAMVEGLKAAEDRVEKAKQKLDAASKKVNESKKDLRTTDDGKNILSKTAKENIISTEGKGLTGASGTTTDYEAIMKLQNRIASLQDANLKKAQEGLTLTDKEKQAALDKIQKLREEGKLRGISLTNEQLLNQAILGGKVAAAEKQKIERLSLQSSKAQNELLDAEKNLKKNILDLQKQQEAAKLDDPAAIKLQQENLEKSIKLEQERAKALGLNKTATKKATDEDKKYSSALDKTNHSLGAATKNVINYAVVIQTLRRVYRETIRTIKDLDQALTEMAIVTTMNREETWGLLETFQDLAKETGFATTEIAKLSTVYFRQGRQLKDVIELTTVAAKAARIAGISAQESADYLTSAINGFGLAAEKALEVSDKFAALAATSASSYQELAVGLSKFAAQANVAGLSIDFALGMLAKGVETTREAPESIGTAMKTVLARMREISDYGKTLDDGMDVSRVEGALKSIGVRLRDTSGQFRDMEEVLKEVGMSWDTLNKNQQASVAVALAGTRQQSRLLAIFQDFDRTLELVDESQESAGATNAQHQEYMKSMEAALTRLQTAWQQFITTITDSEVIIGIIKGISWVVEGFASILEKMSISGKNAMIAIGLLIAVLQSKAIIMKTLTILGFAETVSIRKNIALTWQEVTAKASKVAVDKADNLQKQKGLMYYGLLLIAKLKQVGVTLMSTKATVLNTAAIGGQTVAVKIGTLAWTGFWIAATAGAAAVIAIIIGLAKLIIDLFKEQQKLNRSIKEVKDEYSALNYELNKTNKSMKELIDKYKELSNKKIKTKEDIKALEDLGEQLKSFGEDSEFAEIDIQGNINWDKSIENLNKAISDNEIQIRDNMAEIFYHAVQLGVRKGFNRQLIDTIIEYAVEDFSWGLEKGLSEIEKEGLEIVLSAKIDEGSLQEELKNLTREEQLIFLDENYGELLQNTLNDISPILDKFEDTDLSIVNKFKDFNTASEDVKEALRALYPELTSLFDLMDDNENFYNVLDDSQFDISTISELATIIDAEGKSISGTLENITNRYNKLLKTMSEEEAYATIFSELAAETENADRRMELFNLGLQRGLQKTAQDADQLSNTLKNMKDTQSKYLKGDLSQEELNEFLEKHSTLIKENPNFWNDFANGADITKYKTQELRKVYEGYEANLISVRSQMKFATKEQKAALEVQEQMILALMEYNGELDKGGDALKNYNTLFEQYQRLLKYGIDDLYLYNQAQENLWQYTISQLTLLDSLIDDQAESFDEGLGSIEDYIEMVNGVPILKTDALTDLDPDDLSIFEEWYNGYLDLLNQQYSVSERYIDEDIKNRQAEVDKKIKIYKDYFDALDRLENKRDREQTREDIIAQLQRLEGATDERSRQRAKELRQDLNKLDKKSAEEQRKQEREDFLQMMEDEKDNIAEAWGLAMQQVGDAADSFAEKIRLAIIAAGDALGFETPEETPEEAPTVQEIMDSKGTMIAPGKESQYQASLDYWKGTGQDEETTYNDLVGQGLIIDRAASVEGMMLNNNATVAPEMQSAYEASLEYWRGTGQDEETTYNDLVRQKIITEGPTSLYTEPTPDEIAAQNQAAAAEAQKQKDYEFIFNNIAAALGMYAPGLDLSNITLEKLKEAIPNPAAWKASLPEGTTQKDMLNKFRADYESNNGVDFINDAYAMWTGDFIRPNRYDDAWKTLFKNTIGYKKGGLVDYTGPAMVHGTSSSPEAFLNADQTALFANLRDILGKVAVGGDSIQSSINIENITIQTAQMNSNQDFKSAGETLAKAFNSAIKSRGINLNTKR